MRLDEYGRDKVEAVDQEQVLMLKSNGTSPQQLQQLRSQQTTQDPQPSQLPSGLLASQIATYHPQSTFVMEEDRSLEGQSQE